MKRNMRDDAHAEQGKAGGRAYGNKLISLLVCINGHRIGYVEKAMRVIIQNLLNKLFMNGASEWGPEEEAYDFRTVAFAVDLCLMRRLRQVRIITESGDPATDL